MVSPRVECISGERIGAWRSPTMIALHIDESYASFFLE